jgi:pyruvate ferredoxin oxidoreductase gamma subunit
LLATLIGSLLRHRQLPLRHIHPSRMSEEQMHEIRLVGRGGQGVVTAGELLGRAALRAGWWPQSIPTFGPERRGALSQATLRLDREEVLLKCTTSYPDLLLVLDPTIWHQADVCQGLQARAKLIFNTSEPPEDVAAALTGGRHGYRINADRCTVYTVDATAIAIEELGRPITNTAMMGALVGATGLVEFAAVAEVLEERFGKRAQGNIAAAARARDSLQEVGV